MPVTFSYSVAVPRDIHLQLFTSVLYIIHMYGIVFRNYYLWNIACISVFIHPCWN